MFTTAAVPDVRVFTSRVRRLDPAALIRLRPEGPATVRLWTILPIRVLATLAAFGEVDGDTTVRAADLEAALPSLPAARLDHQWRGSLPTGRGEVLEELTGDECRRLGQAAATTLESARGRGVGDRRLRDALLDHVAIQVSGDSGAHDVRLRLVIGLLRMGLAPPGDHLIRVRLAAGRLGLESSTGAVWESTGALTVL